MRINVMTGRTTAYNTGTVAPLPNCTDNKPDRIYHLSAADSRIPNETINT